jgi:hypothetical protein
MGLQKQDRLKLRQMSDHLRSRFLASLKRGVQKQQKAWLVEM